jgi:hypothetical protein
MVGSSVPDGAGCTVEAGALAAGASPADGAPVEGVSGVCEGLVGAGCAVAGALSPGALDGAPVAGASGVGEGWVGAGKGVCAEARTLSAASTHNATAH